MNIRKAIFCGTVLAFTPCVVKADIDPTTLIQDKLANVQEEINKTLKTYTGQEMNLQQLVNSRDKLGELKNMGKTFALDYAKDYLKRVKVHSFSVKGITEGLKGAVATPEMAGKIGQKMTQKAEVSEDVKKAKEHQKLINDLQVENVAAMYAKSLVLRRAIITENEELENEEKEEMTDLSIIENAYKVVSNRANGRWKTILDSEANFSGQLATAGLLSIRADMAAEEEEKAMADAQKKAKEEAKKAEEEAKKAEEEAKKSAEENKDNDGKSKPNWKDVGNSAKDAYNNIKNGNYSGALGDLSGAAGSAGLGQGVSDALSKAGSTYDKGQQVKDNIENGNYGAALGNLGGAAGAAGLGDGVSDALSGSGDIYNAGKGLADNVGSGNWSGALDNIVSGAEGLNNATGNSEEEVAKREAAAEAAKKAQEEKLHQSLKDSADKLQKETFGSSSPLGRGSSWSMPKPKEKGK